jgi:hypothetical protein
MTNWSGWDWISYGCLGFAAIGLAVGAWGKEYPEMFSGLPSFFSSPKWAAVPAVLFVAATVTFMVRMFLVPTTPPAAQTANSSSQPAVVTTSAPVPFKKMFTAYDIEQRIRVIDELYGLLSTNVISASAAGERLNKSLANKIVGKTAAADLTAYASATETTLTNYFETAGRYMIFPDIYHDATALVWNPFEVVTSARNLGDEIKSLEQQDLNVVLYLKSNKFMAEFNTAMSGRFWTWINEKQQLLTKKRREYEAAPVYPK